MNCSEMEVYRSGILIFCLKGRADLAFMGMSRSEDLQEQWIFLGYFI